MEEGQVKGEFTAPAASNEPVFKSESKKTGKGMIIGLIVLAVLAAGGIGFGAYGLIQSSQKDNQISDLKTQVTNCRNAMNDADQNEPVTCPDNTGTSVNDDTTTEAVNTEDYIYIGEYGIKIKKPENWKTGVREYSFYNGYPQAVDSFEIRESSEAGAGVRIDTKKGQTCDSTNNTTCFMVGDTAIEVVELVGELTPGAAKTASAAFVSHFSNPENYSKI